MESSGEENNGRRRRKSVLRLTSTGWVGDALVGSIGKKDSALAQRARRQSQIALSAGKECPNQGIMVRRQSFEALPCLQKNISRLHLRDQLDDVSLAENRTSPPDSECGIDGMEKKEGDNTYTIPPLKLHCGMVIDWLTRHRSGCTHFSEQVSKLLDGGTSSPEYAFVVAYVNQEMLYSEILDDVIYFWNELGNSAWRNDSKIISKRFWEICQWKREALCLKAEVSNWMFRHKLLRGGTEVAETQKERHARQQEFWAQLHEAPQKLEVQQPLRASCDQLCAVQERPGELTPPRSPGKSLDVKKSRSNDVQWKARPARSRCSAGTWDWANGSAEVPKPKGCTAGTWSFEDAPDFALEPRDIADRNVLSTPHRQAETRPHFRWWKDRQPDLFAATPFVIYDDQYPRRSGTRGGCSGARGIGYPSASHSPVKRRSQLELRTSASLPALGSHVGSESHSAKTRIASFGCPSSSGSSEKRSIEQKLCSKASLPALGSRAGIAIPSAKSSGSLWHIRTQQHEVASGRSGSLLTSPMATSLCSTWRSYDMQKDEVTVDSSRSLLALPSRGPLCSSGHMEAMHHAFPVPWQGKSPIPALKCQDSATKKYLHAVHGRGGVPKPLPFITGHSLNFTPGDGSLCDEDLDSVVDMMEGMQVKVEEVSLDGHTSLSEKSITAFVKALAKFPACTTLKRLSLKRCVNAAQLTCDVIIDMLSDLEHGCAALRHLDLSSVPIGSRRYKPLAKAIGEHAGLHTLSIADTGLGSAPQSEKCIHYLLGSASLKTLDIGWNCFSEEVFSVIGGRLIENPTLTSLSMANASSGAKAADASPIVHFIEHLSRDKSLRYLDISLNRIDFRAALVIEDALETHKFLSELNLSHNPLGFLGMRSILRLLCNNSSGLTSLLWHDCNTGNATTLNEIFQVFSATNPCGRYILEFHRPYHRSLLRMLYKTAEHFQLSPDQAFSDMKSKPQFAHGSKDSCGVWVIPATGNLAATFSIEKAMAESLKDVDPFDFVRVADMLRDFTRVKPGFRKAVPLLALWKSINGCSSEQKVLLQALSDDFILSYKHIEVMARVSRHAVVEIIQNLLPCVEGGQMARCFSIGLLPSLGELMTIRRYHQSFLTFNIENPNAHYILDLENVGDHSVAEQLILLDTWESGVAKSLKRFDTSQKGNYSQFRNETHQYRPLGVAHIQDWKMPETDVLEFDYSSGRRPPVGAQMIDTKAFSNILINLQCSDCLPKEQIIALQLISHHIFISCTQLRSMLGLYKNEQIRLDLCVLWFGRIIDFYNEKVFRVRFESESELIALRNRLGWITTFPCIQPEQSKFKLNYAHYEQRAAASILVGLSAKEGSHNLRDVSFVDADGYEDPLTAGLPRSWEDLNKIPKGGNLVASYMCSPEERSFKCRRDFFEKFSHRKLDKEEKEIMWWATISDTPTDVMDYLQWINARFQSPRDCFVKIDGGPGGNGVLSLREFETSFKDLDCNIFKGPGELQRIHALFRFLDPSGEGEVSLGEWEILDSLAQEINLSITEFVEYCTRMFGPHLSDTWIFMDAEGRGHIDFHEWCRACNDLRYFGLVEPIFRYLDADNEGTISMAEFKELEKFQNEERQRSEYVRHNSAQSGTQEERRSSGFSSSSIPDASGTCSRGHEGGSDRADTVSSRVGTPSVAGSRPLSQQNQP